MTMNDIYNLKKGINIRHVTTRCRKGERRMKECITFDELIRILPCICQEQRHFLKISQADVVKKLEKEKGIIKDQSKISMYESGKIAIPEFLSDYCSVLNILFLNHLIERSLQWKITTLHGAVLPKN